MHIVKKVCGSIVFKGSCSIIAGAAMVTLFSILLTAYGASKEAKIAKVSQKHIEFPQNEEMLDKMAFQLAKEAQTLSDIAPASGDADIDTIVEPSNEVEEPAQIEEQSIALSETENETIYVVQ